LHKLSWDTWPSCLRLQYAFAGVFREKKKFAHCLKHNHHKLYVSTKLMNALFSKNCFSLSLIFSNRKESTSQKPKMADVYLREFIGYWIRLQNQNYCIRTVTRRQFSKLCETIFLSILMIKNCVLRQRPLSEINYEKRKSLTRFFVQCLGHLRAKFQGNPSNSHTIYM